MKLSIHSGLAILCAVMMCQAVASAQQPKRKVVEHNEPALIQSDENGALHMIATKAELYGREGDGTIAIYDGQMCIGWWTSNEDYAVWEVQVPEAGVYNVNLHWSIPGNWSGNYFSISCGEHRLINRIQSTGGFEHFKWANYGTIYLPKGKHRITMKAVGPVHGEIADIKEVRLTPHDMEQPDVPGGGMTPAASLAAARIPDGFELTTFAAEPWLTNPTSICVDTHGRVWVAEAAVYRFYRAAGQNQMPLVDRIKVLEDTDGDGKADKMTVFYEGLMSPMSLAVAGNKVYVAESPYLYVLEDKDGDLRADSKEVLLEGFGGYNDDQALHGLALGPDHKLYMTQGDLTFDVTGPDGRHVKHDVGGVLRCEFDGKELEVIAWDLKNPIEVAVNSFGDAWFSGNDDDGQRMCRLDFTLDGGYYGWRFWGVYGERRDTFGSGAAAHWHANEIGVIPPVLITGFGAPCGKMFVEDGTFGERYRGALFHVDPGPRTVNAYQIEQNGAAFETRAETFVLNETDTYFRPIDAALAPDGSMYICDWYDIAVGGHTYNDPNRGRIYRLTRTGAHKGRIGKAGPFHNDADAAEALKNPNKDTQFLARQRLIDSNTRAVPHLKTLLRSDDEVIVARALWVLDRIGGEARTQVVNHLEHESHRLRALAVRILRRHGEEYQHRLLQLTNDPSAEVRREIALSTRDHVNKAADEALLNIAKQWDGEDRFYLEAIGIAARGRAGQANDRFKSFRGDYTTHHLSDTRRMDWLFEELVEKGEESFGPRTIAFAKLLKPHQAEAYLLDRMRKEPLPESLQIAIITSLGPSADIDTGRALLGMLGRENVPVGIEKVALEAVSRNINGSWRELREDASFDGAVTWALNHDPLRQDAMALVKSAEHRKSAPTLRAIVADGSIDESDRTTAIALLGMLKDHDAGSLLADIVTDTRNSLPLRNAARNALIAVFNQQSLRSLLIGEALDADEKTALADEISATVQGAAWLLQLIQKDELSGDLRERVIKRGMAHVDTNVRTLYLQLLPDSQRPRMLGSEIDTDAVLALQGDPKRGAQVFANSAASCSRCHMVNGEGRDVGPNLSVIGRKHGRDGLVLSILQPSAAISPDYATAIVETQWDGILIGFVAENAATNEVRVKISDGSIVTLPRDEVVRITPRSVSLMPEQLAGAMTAQDLADLVAYLASLRSETHIVPFWWALGAFPNDDQEGFNTDFGPETKPERINHKATYAALDDRQVRWEQIETQPFENSRGVDLQGFLAERDFRAGDIVTYYTVAVDSPTDQDATLLIGSEDAVKVWLNGEQVHSHFVRRKPARLGQDEVTIHLNQGKNVLMVKLEQVGAGGGLIAAIRAAYDITFSKP